MSFDPNTPAGADFAARSLAHEAIKSQLSFERVKRVAQSQGKRVPSRLAVAVAQTRPDPRPRVAKAADDAPVACYDVGGQLLGVVDPDKLTKIDPGSCVYDQNGAAIGIIGGDQKLTPFSDPAAVAAVAKSLAAQGAAVAKKLQAHRVSKGLSPTPTGRGKPVDAVEWLTALGLRINAERVAKGMTPATSDTRPIPPLVAAAIAYHHSTPAQKLAVRKVLARATPASRKAARIALLNAETAALGPRPTVPRR